MGPIANANAKWLEGKIGFWNDVLAHPNRDAWWQARDPRPFYKDSKPAVMTVGGWYDAEDSGARSRRTALFEKSAKNENVP